MEDVFCRKNRKTEKRMMIPLEANARKVERAIEEAALKCAEKMMADALGEDLVNIRRRRAR